MPYSTVSRFAIALLLAALLGNFAAPAVAQERFGFGLRLGVFEPTGFSDSYEALYGDTFTQIGLRFEAALGDTWWLLASLDHGSVDGELIAVLPNGMIEKTGEPTELTLTPLHVSAAYRFVSGGPWTAYLGGGLTLLSWEEATFRDTSSTDPGVHAMAGLRRDLGRLGVGAEALWSTVPDALPEDGVAALFGDDDLGGLSLSLLAVWGF